VVRVFSLTLHCFALEEKAHDHRSDLHEPEPTPAATLVMAFEPALPA
jgi:hypothetical protein